ncbi:hypothetical protein GCM10017044_11960 [Kordiimonas sediminis]|uniref:PAS fold-4 domain-containing protein n=1 Tax=Kordiimonas sediminis TaxID=1735581 RepID=A0A919APW6_9PROT|nr:PAS domain-containing protein [Kordiimonas sediminis]GHF19013.1 hypothetical protein GCM10017044_11960 [Kordiimonas sediminis]
MNALDNRIRELVAYAREKDGEDRTVLYRNLVDMFLTGKAPLKEPTRGQLLGVLDALVPHVEVEARRVVADLLANMSDPPMDLVQRVCRDRASIVSGLLLAAPFTEDELIDLIETTGREHHQEIASRGDLSANVWIALARATPAAPPYESQSTLALWSDELCGPDITGLASATVTHLHPKKEKAEKPAGSTAKLRILRTNEDLMSDHMDADDALGDFKLTSGAPVPVDTGKRAPILPSEADNTLTSNTLTSRPATASKPATTPAALAQSQAKDKPAAPRQDNTVSSDIALPKAASGGWSWFSDRDGRIVGISDLGLELFGEKPETMNGMPMIEMLGLGMKVGHPVARAFQRRSHIHDAPLYLSHLKKGERYWTLDARPIFSATGVFEGYEGILMPVVPAEGEEDIIPAQSDLDSLAASELLRGSGSPARNDTRRDSLLDEGDTPLFTEDVKPSFRRSASDLDETAHAQIKNSLTEALGGLGDLLRDEENAAARTQHQPGNPSAGAGATQTDADSHAFHLDADTVSASWEYLQKTLNTSKQEDDSADEPSSPQEHSAKVESAPIPAAQHPQSSDDIGPIGQPDPAALLATLDMLQEALSRLSTASETGNKLQVRLQTEIATACARTLRDQLLPGSDA